ncbi:MAG: putative bifunctional diguanylate cyclase/phosphodiesterase [Pseudomonadales bacterium]
MHRDPLLACLNTTHFFCVARCLFPGIASMRLLGAQRDLLQESDKDIKTSDEELIAAIENLVIEAGEERIEQGFLKRVEDQQYIYSRNLRTYTDALIGTLVVEFSGIPDHDPASLSSLEELFISDYQLNMELDSATMELTDRYEELNLIYGTDDSAEQFDKGHSVMANLVLQCSERMNVATTILCLPDQNILIVEHADQQSSRHDIERLASDVFMPWIVSVGGTLVVNDEFDDELKRYCPELEQKILICPIYGYASQACGYIGVLNDLACGDFSNSDRNLLQILSRKASRVVKSNYDELTGLANKVSFEFLLDELIKQSEAGAESSLLLIDLRGLHVVNDSAGNDAGDALIRETGRLLDKGLTPDSFLSRLEGDIFAVAFKGSDIDQSYEIAKNILAAVNSMQFEWQGVRFHTNVSMGLIPISLDQDAQQAISTAKIALQMACDKGNNLIEVQSSDNGEIALRKERMRSLNTIHDALENDHFELYCQGIFPTQPGAQPHHYEVLLRLRDAEGNLVSPDVFIPAAEHYKVMPDVDRWVLRNSLLTLSESWDVLQNTSQSWAINLSGQTFAQPDLIDFISSELENCIVPAERIAFEITETVAVDDLSAARRTIEQVQDLGCEFYLDDFGTGLSSFTYLQELPFNHVKIDGRFVKEVGDDKVAQAMVKAISDVAHVLGMSTVAEYVENDAIIAVLRTLGVEYLQGYGLHKPEPIIDVINRVRANSRISA